MIRLAKEFYKEAKSCQPSCGPLVDLTSDKIKTKKCKEENVRRQIIDFYPFLNCAQMCFQAVFIK